MPASKAQQKAVNKYMKENYDRVNLTMPKGEKEAVKAHAEARGESVNSFINRAINRHGVNRFGIYRNSSKLARLSAATRSRDVAT